MSEALDSYKNTLNSNMTMTEATFRTVTSDSKSSTWITTLDNSNVLPSCSNMSHNDQRTSNYRTLNKESQNSTDATSTTAFASAQQTHMQPSNSTLQERMFYHLQQRYPCQQQVNYLLPTCNTAQYQQSNSLPQQWDPSQVQANAGFNDANSYPSKRNSCIYEDTASTSSNQSGYVSRPSLQNAIVQDSSNFPFGSVTLPYWFAESYAEQQSMSANEPPEYNDFNLTDL